MLNDAKLVKDDLNLLQELLDDSWISGIYIAGHGNDPEAPGVHARSGERPHKRDCISRRRTSLRRPAPASDLG